VIALNQRKHQPPASGSLRKKIHILVEFPHPELESVVIEWENMPPSIFVQVKRNVEEPLQFPGKRADWEQAKPSASTEPTELSGVLKNFIDPATGLRFSDYAFNVDITSVFSPSARTRSCFACSVPLGMPGGSSRRNEDQGRTQRFS
jgi:hypothetical protein